jgi:hypothetical protein
LIRWKREANGGESGIFCPRKAGRTSAHRNDIRARFIPIIDKLAAFSLAILMAVGLY